MRHRHTKSALCASWAALALAMPANSQDATAAPAVDQSDIVVTARRVEERLQDVPISITVFNQAQIDKRNVVSVGDLATYTPSLTSSSRFGAGNATFAIRGFTQELRTSPSVAVYFADVVSPRGGNGGTPAGNGAAPGAFFDLQNVQVLKGPQGTLFGRNTTGGAVLLVPKKPTGQFEGYVEGTYGNYDMKRVQAVANVPLSDAARLRVGVDRYDRDGYLRNISGIGPSRFNDIDYVAARASLVLDLMPDLENYTILSYVHSDSNGPVSKVTNCVQSVALFGPLACAQIARGRDGGFFAVDNNTPDPRALLNQWQIINTTTWKASDALTVKNIASYSEFKNILRAEIFGTRFVIPQGLGSVSGQQVSFTSAHNPAGFPTADQSTVTEELQFQGQRGTRLDWQAGGYLELSDPLRLSGSQSPVLLDCSDISALRCTDPIGTLARRPGTGSINFALGRTSFRNVGVYSQATYAFSDQLKLTGGVRYTWDRTRTSATLVTYRFLQPNVPTAFCTLAPSGTPPVTDAGRCFNGATQRSDAPTWLIDLDYSPSRDVLLYAKYARGYRQGSANYSAPAGFLTFGPERVDTYEVGAKTSLRGPLRATFNVAGFYNDFTDQQLAVGLLSSTNAAVPTQAIVNAGKSRIYGAEVEGSTTPFRGLTLDGSYAYLNTKLRTLDVPPLPTGGAYDTFQFAAVPGSRLAFTPKHKLSATATYALPLPEDVGRVTVGTTYSYTSNQLIVISPFGLLPSFDTLNVNLNWDGVAGLPLDASFFATNVTNERYFNYINDQSRQGFVSRTISEPRMYGVRLRYRFAA